MLLVFFLCFNWCAGLSLTGPVVYFYVRPIKKRRRERKNGGREDGGRHEKESRTGGAPQTRRAVCSSFHLSLSHRSFSPFSCLVSFPAFTSPASSLHPPVPAVFHAVYICLPLSFVSLFACFLHSFHSSIKNISTFLPFIYVLYITSHSFIHCFQEWRPLVKSVCVCVLLGAMQCCVFINKSIYIEHKPVYFFLNKSS